MTAVPAVRMAVNADFEAIAKIARDSFPEPFGWWHDPRYARFYSPLACRVSREGELRVAVACAPDQQTAGFIFYRVKAGAALYVVELAARSSTGRVRFAGTALLLFAAVDGLAASGDGTASLQVPAASGAPVSPDPLSSGCDSDVIRFYTQRGFSVVPGLRGVMRGGRASFDGIRMTGHVDDVIDQCRHILRVGRGY